MRLIDGKWVSQKTVKQRGLMDYHLVTDGTRAYIVNLAVSNEIELRDIADLEAKAMRFPVAAGTSMQSLQKSVQTHARWSPYVVIILFSMAASRLMSIYRASHYEFGNRVGELASLTRRALAKIIDGLSVGLPVIALERVWLGELDESEAVTEFIAGGFEDPSKLRMLFFILLGLTLYGVTCLIIAAILEGRWGTSPGKWLLGIRVVRTTLRPSGFLRAALRELLLIADAFVCCGWLPGACFVAFTDFRQRIGDFVADTLVIRARELPIK
jgi:uncharacterized RDD family membrane protein YckC